MNDPASVLSGMMSFDSISLYEQPKPRFIFKMPRVVPDQKSKFESDELFRRLSRESEVSLLYNTYLDLLNKIIISTYFFYYYNF